jgi:hypothetical protein
MRLSIKVLGPGCVKCNLLERHAVEALEILAEEIPTLEATIQHVSDYDEMLKYPIVVTPALVINERVVSAGHVPVVNKVIGWLREALDENK